MSSFSFDEGENPGLTPTDHPDFDDEAQFVQPSELPSFFPPMAPGPGDNDTIIPREESDELPEDHFDPRMEQDITGLMFLGFLQRRCEVYGHSFTLRSLRGGEDLAVAQIVDEQPGLTSQAKALGMAQVAAALLTVDGKRLAAPLTEDHEQVIAAIRQKMHYVQKWHPRIHERLFEEYQELQLRVDEALRAYEGKLTAGRPVPLP